MAENKTLPYGVVAIVAVFILALNQIVDTDAWMHLNLGRLIWENGGIPDKESFVYPAQDLPFLYTSWLFSVLLYVVYLLFDVNGIILLKASVISIAFYVLFADALRRNVPSWFALVIVVLFAILSRDRFVERPDIFLFLFLALNALIVNAYLKTGSKSVYFLPLIHLLWANIHSSVILLTVPYLAAIGGLSVSYWLSRKGVAEEARQSLRKIKILSILMVVSIVLTGINPNGFTQLFFGQTILATDFFKEEIAELKPPTWEHAKLTFIVTAIILFALTIKVMQTIRTESYRALFSLQNLFDLALLLPFLVVAWTSIRFVYPLMIVATPVVAAYLASGLRGAKFNSIIENRVSTFGIVATAIVLAVFSTLFFNWPSGLQRSGFGENYIFVPESALSFMDQNHINGRVYNTFRWGGYIAWRDGSKRSVFVDPRGYIPIEHQEDIKNALESEQRLGYIQQKFGFESILISFQPPKGGREKTSHFKVPPKSAWALVYWDDVSVLYLRRGGPYQMLIDRYEYKYVNPSLGFAALQAYLADARKATLIIDELRRNTAQTNSYNAKMLLGFVYAFTGKFDESLSLLRPLLDLDQVDMRAVVQRWLGYIYQRRGNLAEAINAYEVSLALQDDIESLFNLGKAYYDAGDFDKAVKRLESYVEFNPQSSEAYRMLIQIYQSKGEFQKVESLQRLLQKSASIAQSQEKFNRGVAAYSNGNLDLAEEMFMESIRLNPSAPIVHSNLGFLMYDKGDLEGSLRYHKRALELNSQFANSHYGAGLAYKKLGKSNEALKHFQVYLELVPNGYFSRRARQYLDDL